MKLLQFANFTIHFANFIVHFSTFIIQFVTHFGTKTDATTSSSWDLEAHYPGNLQLGGLFPIHRKDKNGLCSSEITVDGILHFEAFLYSLDKINEILEHNVSFKLGAVSLDTCGSDKQAPAKALKFVFKDYIRKEYKQNSIGSATGEVIGVVGPMISTVTIALANLFGLFSLPQISYSATSRTLSNAKSYPYFMRTVPSDDNQAKSLVEILRFWNWTYVAGIYEDSNYGTRGFSEFEKLSEETDVCIAYRWKIELDHVYHNNYKEKLKELQLLNIRVVILYMQPDVAMQIFSAAHLENMTNFFIWIGTDGWGNRHMPKVFNEVLKGALISVPVVKDVPEFDEYFYSLKPSTNYRNPWFSEFWESYFNCTFNINRHHHQRRCNEKENLNDHIHKTEFGFMHFVRNAVYTFGHALISMHKVFCKNRGLCDELKKRLENLDAQPFLSYLRNVNFDGIDGSEVRFVNGRDGLPIYSIKNFQKMNDSVYEWVNVATFSYTDNSTWIVKTNATNNNQDYYSNFAKKCHIQCPAGHIRRYRLFEIKCCWTCEPCPFPTYKQNETNCMPCITSNQSRPPFYRPSIDLNSCMVLDPVYVDFTNPFISFISFFSAAGLCLVVCTAITFLTYSTTPVIKASGRELSFVLLLGITVCYGTVFVIVLEPNAYVCSYSRFSYSLGYTVSYSSIFIKMNRIARIFGDRCPKQKTKYVSPTSQIFMVSCLIGFQCVLNTVWLILRPPLVSYGVDLQYDTKTVVVQKFCEAFTDSSLLIGLIFPIFLLLLSSVYAFKTRKTPGKFNETKFIVITNYSTCIVWLAFVPIFFSTEKIQLRIYSLCAALVMNATVTLFCMFVPKLYMVLCRSHKNTKDSVMGRKPGGSMLSSASPAKSEHSRLLIPLLDNDGLLSTKLYRKCSGADSILVWKKSRDVNICECSCHMNQFESMHSVRRRSC